MTEPSPPTLQNLPPAAARLCLEVERFCLTRLGLAHGARLLLALSGGADSTALALILRLLAPRLGLTLHALSIDHGLRQESAEDTEFTLQLCRNLDIPCAVRQADVRGMTESSGIGIEDAARRLRYALLEQERAAVGADFIALGHHAGDVSEDVLLRLTRGTGWPALGGMVARDDGRRLLRPMLATDPQALRQLLDQCGIGWREDASNQSRDFKRNRLRLDVLPLLREENPSLDRTLHDLWQMARLDEDYWNTALDAALAAHPWVESGGGNSPAEKAGAADAPSLTLPAALLAGLHPAARLRLYMRAVRWLCRPAGDGGCAEAESTGCVGSGGNTENMVQLHGQARARTLLALDDALASGRGNTRFQLPGGLEAYLKGGSIVFRRCAAGG